MAGVACPNLPTAVYARDPRDDEVPSADWVGGVNRGASNANFIGICTGVKNPKVQDFFPLLEPTITSQIIGLPSDPAFVRLMSATENYVGWAWCDVAECLPGEQYSFGLLTNLTCMSLFNMDWAHGQGAIIPPFP